MSQPRYVQHISGQGEKWKVSSELVDVWYASERNERTFLLPKSEYVLVEPPEQWVDVTEKILNSAFKESDWFHNPGSQYVLKVNDDRYRLRKVQMNNHDYKGQHWAFIVERRAP